YGEPESTSQLSRRHAVSEPVPGLVTVAGGKFTTYRVMAKDAVDAAARHLPAPVPVSCTDQVALVGAEGYRALHNQRFRLAKQTGLDVIWIEHLLTRHGSAMDQILELVGARPELGQPLAGGEDYLSAEVVHAVVNEGALHLEDVLTRRTRLSIETFDRGLRAGETAVKLMAGELGWDGATQAAELEHYRLRVRAERESQAQPDDLSADAARQGLRRSS
ncbi:MAG: glycerol-3-phosphate dehydrogenase C-terminal domain-containing protein, partial [Acidimicrobiales bacterium]